MVCAGMSKWDLRWGNRFNYAARLRRWPDWLGLGAHIPLRVDPSTKAIRLDCAQRVVVELERRTATPTVRKARPDITQIRMPRGTAEF